MTKLRETKSPSLKVSLLQLALFCAINHLLPPLGGLVLTRFDPQMWNGAGIALQWDPWWFHPPASASGRCCADRNPGSRGAETQAALGSCRGVAGWGVVGSGEEGEGGDIFPKAPAGSEGLGEARKNNPQIRFLQAPPGSWKAEMCAAAGGQVRQGGR